MKQQLVSIIMPAYNCKDTIRASMLSALRQTANNLELIVVNDCSSDCTSEIIAEIAASDSRVKILKNEKNIGVAASRNYAIDVASGELLAFLDADDIWESPKLEKQIALMQKTGCDLCYSSYDYFDYIGNPVYRSYFVQETVNYDELLKENVIGLSTAVLNKNVLGNLRFDRNLFHEDLALWLRLLRKGAIARGVPDVLVHNRIGGRSDNKWKTMKNRWRIYREAEGLSLVKSCWCLMFYAAAGLKKYQK